MYDLNTPPPNLSHIHGCLQNTAPHALVPVAVDLSSYTDRGADGCRQGLCRAVVAHGQRARWGGTCDGDG